MLRCLLKSVYKRVESKGRRTVSLNLEALEGRLTPSSASPFKIFGTGLDASAHALADGAADPHYALLSGPSTAAPVVMPQGGFPFPYWAADGAASQWITPGDAPNNAGNGYQEPEGDYVYETTFDLTGYDSATAAIHGLIGADNTVEQVLLNGQDTGYTPTNAGNNFSSLNALDVTSGFTAGLNKLDFVVHNDAGDSWNPTGFRAELSGTAQLAGTPFASLATGTDGNGNLLSSGAQDQNWQLVSAPAPDATGAPYVTINNGFPFDHWTANGDSSQWVSPEANENDAAGGSTDPVGTYTYQTTFDLTGYDPSTATLAGYVSADNTLEKVLLNGQDVGYTPDPSGTDYTAMHPIAIASGFQGGVNTLQFVVYNAPQGDGSGNAHNPSAFRAELTGTAQQINTTALSFQPLAFTEGQEASGVIATFSDPDGNTDPSQYTATVDWGDGYGPQDAAVTGDGSGHFQVVGDYAYAEDGAYTAVVTVTGIADGPVAMTQGEVAVADAPLTANALTLSGVAGTPFTGPVGSFTDTNPAGSLADFTASTVSWGDGKTSDATVTTGPTGAEFTVQAGAHTYAVAGNYTVQVTVNDAGGQSVVLSNTVAVSATAPPPQNNVVHVNAWSDMNRNHDWESLEPGLRFAEVKLYDSNGAEAGDLLTDKDGHAIQNFADGDYTVGLTAPTGYSLEMLKLSGLPGTSGPIILTIDPTTHRSQSFHLAASADVTLNAALVQAGTAVNQILGPSVVPGNTTYVYAVDFDHTVTNIHWTRIITTPTDPPADTVTAGTSYTSENEAGTSVAETLSFGNSAPAQITLSLTDDQGDALSKAITVVQVRVADHAGIPAFETNQTPRIRFKASSDFGNAEKNRAAIGVDTLGAKNVAALNAYADIVLTGPNGNQGVDQIKVGFIQHVAISMQAVYLGPSETQTAKHDGVPLSDYGSMLDQDAGATSLSPWYQVDPFHVFSAATPESPDGRIFTSDSPTAVIPFDSVHSPYAVLNLNTWPNLDKATQIRYTLTLTLDVAAETKDNGNDAASLYYVESRAPWSVDLSGAFHLNLNAASPKDSTITYVPFSTQPVTAPTSWSGLAVTAPTLEDTSGPVANDLTHDVTFS